MMKRTREKVDTLSLSCLKLRVGYDEENKREKVDRNRQV
jgi:hypothetical protein